MYGAQRASGHPATGRLLRAARPNLARSSRRASHLLQNVGGEVADRPDAIFGELRKRKMQAGKKHGNHRHDGEDHTAVRDRSPRNVDSRLAF